MIPGTIIDYLERNKVPFKRRPHARAVSAQELAAALHTTGYAVVKSVLLDVDGQKWIAVLPAVEVVDLARIAAALGARRAQMLAESEFISLFPNCEPGAEPPFGRLYGLPVIIDRTLSKAVRIVLRAGSHQESIELDYSDFLALEKPKVGQFGILESSTSMAERHNDLRPRT